MASNKGLGTSQSQGRGYPTTDDLHVVSNKGAWQESVAGATPLLIHATQVVSSVIHLPMRCQSEACPSSANLIQRHECQRKPAHQSTQSYCHGLRMPNEDAMEEGRTRENYEHELLINQSRRLAHDLHLTSKICQLSWHAACLKHAVSTERGAVTSSMAFRLRVFPLSATSAVFASQPQLLPP